MSQSRIGKRLTDISERLQRLRADLAVAEEQCLYFTEVADDARIRALVSETPSAAHQHRQAARQAETMTRHKVRLRDEIQRLEQQQDHLLDRYSSDG